VRLQSRNLNKHDRLRRRNLEAFAAANVFAHQLVINPHHIIAGFIKLRAFMLVHIRGAFSFFDASSSALRNRFFRGNTGKKNSPFWFPVVRQKYLFPA
jgi:hypothetical protein